MDSRSNKNRRGIAWRKVSEFMLRNRDLLSLSFRGFTVEEEYGCLEFISVALQPLFQIPPVLGCPLANELPEQMQEAYQEGQLGAWLNRDSLQVNCSISIASGKRASYRCCLMKNVSRCLCSLPLNEQKPYQRLDTVVGRGFCCTKPLL